MDRRELFRTAGAALPAIALLSPARLDAMHRALRRDGSGALRALDAHQAETVATITELIIPTTDTPGARAAHVTEFIDLMLAELSDADDRARFVAGVADVDARSNALFGTPFVAATPENQTRLLQMLEAEGLEARAIDREARPFFADIKWLTLLGYYTSEVGQTQELHNVIVPGRYEACMAIAPAPQGGLNR